GHARPGRVGDPAPARVDRQASATAADAPFAVELDRHVAQLAAEARRAPDDPAVEHDAGADSRPGREDDERTAAPAGSEHPLPEREGVDVVVHENRESQTLAELGGQGSSSECGDVSDGLADPAARGVDRPGYPDARGADGV